MAKVVTSEGLSDFVQTGKATEIIVDKRQKTEKTAPALELVKTQGSTELEAKPAETPPKEAPKEAKEPEETGLEAEDHDLAERAKKRIGKKHYEMKVAQEEAVKARAEAEESERFAENLFNEREEWRKKAQALEAQTAKPAAVVPTLTKPDPEDAAYRDAKGEFDWRKFSDDNATYAAKKAIADDRQEQRTKAEAEAKEKADAITKKRFEAAAKKYPDWHKVVEKSSVMLPNECLHFIARSEYGTDIAYFLAKNEDIAEKIRVMDPYVAVAELGILSDQFRKPAVKTTPVEATSQAVERPGAPAPITPISTNGTGKINIDPAKMSYKELRAYERERARKH